jgi:hypothetical protein
MHNNTTTLGWCGIGIGIGYWLRWVEGGMKSVEVEGGTKQQ